MSKRIRTRVLQILYIIAVFVAGLFLFSAVLSRQPRAAMQDHASPTLPLIRMCSGDMSFNELYGYTSERDLSLIHPCLTPVGSDRQVTISILPFGNQITDLFYEVRTLSGSRLIERTQLSTEVMPTADETQVAFVLKDLVNENEEYILDLVLTTDTAENVRYYTRIICSTDYDTESDQPAVEAVNFVREFHDKTLEGTDTGYLSNYIEPENNDNTLALVDIHSSMDQITFFGLSPVQETEPVYSMTQISGTQFCLNGWYIISIVDPANAEQTYYYQCREYYRVNKGFDRFHLLNFRRTMTQIFAPETASYVSDSINLGIASEQTQVQQSQDGSKVGFVSAGRLMLASTSDDSITYIFGFSSENSTDPREINPEHDIRILSVTDEGNVDFLVYGYFNEGSHEGNCGIAEYHYIAAEHHLEEKVFLAYRGSYELLKALVESGSYLNAQNHLFLLLDDVLYNIDIDNQTVSLADATQQGSRVTTSSDGRMAAWSEAGTGNIIYTDLSDFSQRRIEPADGESLVLIGFMGEDLFYGIAKESDVGTDLAGNELTPMYSVRVVDHDLNQLEDYEPVDSYVTQAVINGNQVVLHRVRKTDNGYEEIEDDQIVSTQNDSNSTILSRSLLTQSNDGNFGTCQRLAVSGFDPELFRYVEAGEIVYDGVTVDLTSKYTDLQQAASADSQEREHYYVYDIYGFDRDYQDPSDAIVRASAGSGTVIGGNGNYIWEKTTVERCQLDDIGSSAASLSDNENGLSMTTSDYRSAVRDGELTSMEACLEAIIRYEAASGTTITAGTKAPEEANATGTSDSYAVRILESYIPNATSLDLTGCSMENILYYPSIGIPVIARTQNGMILIIGYGPERIAVWNPAEDTGQGTSGASSPAGVQLLTRAAASRMLDAAGNYYLTYVKAQE